MARTWLVWLALAASLAAVEASADNTTTDGDTDDHTDDHSPSITTSGHTTAPDSGSDIAHDAESTPMPESPIKPDKGATDDTSIIHPETNEGPTTTSGGGPTGTTTTTQATSDGVSLASFQWLMVATFLALIS